MIVRRQPRQRMAYQRGEFGRVERINELTIKLTGREEARYRRGTKTYTDKNTFCELEVMSTRDGEQMGFGQAMLTVPGDTMHSFRADNNKIIWTVTVHGDIPKWPDVKEEFEITVVPRGV